MKTKIINKPASIVSSSTKAPGASCLSCLKKTLLLFLLILGMQFSKAQSVSVAVLKSPCNHDGTLEATITGGTPPYTFNWYGVGVNQTHSGTSATDDLVNFAGGSGGVDVRDASGSYFYASFSVSPFQYKTSVTQASCPVKGSASVSITGGKAPFVVNWFDVSTSILVGTGTTVPLPAGSYQVEITDANGCVFGSKQQFDSLYIYDSKPLQVTVNTTPANCTNGSATVASISGGVSPYAYAWSNGANTSSINNLMMGSYTLKVTDSQGCLGTAYSYVNQSVSIGANVTPTDATCLQTNGSAIVFGSGGVPPYSYLFSDGQTSNTATNLSAKYYSVQVTDANGCIGQNWFNINASTPITATYSTTASSCTSATGTANLSITGGTTPFTIDWNTFPVQHTIAAANLAPGSYSFKITDAVGCVRDGAVTIPTISGIAGYSAYGPSYCPVDNGMAEVIVTAGAAPYTYSWSNGKTTPSINNIAGGTYNCVVTDAQNCSITKNVYVPESSSITLGFNTTPATCIFNSDGSIAMNIVGGVSPYTVSWSNGQTTQNATGLKTGEYSVSVIDSKGCTAWSYVYVDYDASSNSCYCTLTGKVYNDANGNCVKDPGEDGVQNIMISNTGMGYTYTDATGIYSMIVPSGNYNIQEVVNSIYPLSSCQSNNNPVTVTASSGCTVTQDFANQINPLHDIHIITTRMNYPVPGNEYVQRVIVQNDGTIDESNIQLGYAHDGQLIFSSSGSFALSQPNSGAYPDWYAISSGFTTLKPAEYTATDITYNVPTNIPLGTTVNFWDTTAYMAPMSNWLTDYSPWNNVNHEIEVVVGSFDPNFKEVFPKGTGNYGYITANDTVLDYVIHFQNTGSASAQKIVVKDQLDANFNWTTLRPGYATHQYRTDLDKNGQITFTFNNINLPDSTANLKGSMGMVAYSIHTKKNLLPGTQFKNKAAIYFDYNAPVITNTTLNTILGNTDGVNEIKTGSEISLYPNPANDNFNLKITSAEKVSDARISLFTIDGNLVFEKEVTLNKGINVLNYSSSDLASGLYFVKVTTSEGQRTVKLSVVK